MAESVATSKVNSRCPTCLATVLLDPAIDAHKQVECLTCYGVFEAGSALPPLEADAGRSPGGFYHAALAGDVERVETPSDLVDVLKPELASSGTYWVFAVPPLLVIVVTTSWYGLGMDGTSFLALYGVAGISLLLSSWLIRHSGHWATCVAR